MDKEVKVQERVGNTDGGRTTVYAVFPPPGGAVLPQTAAVVGAKQMT